MQSGNHSIAVFLTVVLAVVFNLMPYSGDWIVWKPNFLLLVVMGWVLYQPKEFGVYFAASFGLLADILLRMTLGHSVIVFALCVSVIVMVSRWAQYLSLLQRTFLVSLIIGVVGLLEASVFMLYDRPSAIEHLPMKILLSALAWPLIDRLIARSQLQRD